MANQLRFIGLIILPLVLKFTSLNSYPTGPTRALVSDLFYCGTLGPLLTRIKAVWKPHVFNIMNPKREIMVTRTVDKNVWSHDTRIINVWTVQMSSSALNLRCGQLGTIQYSPTQTLHIAVLDILKVFSSLEQKCRS